jgi:formamidopyrimidine-DNA glycosylase
MPELPEVETTLRGIRPWLTGKRIKAVVVRSRKLRWPIPRKLSTLLPGQRIESLERRAKYLLLHVETGTVIMHLGMSGSMRIARPTDPPGRHDHFELVLPGRRCLRFRDPRRFGCILWTAGPPEEHSLLERLGPEPLGPQFSGDYLHAVSRGRRVAVKSLLMNNRIVVGVGNIYASESLYASGIHPHRAAGRISRRRYEELAKAVRHILTRAIRAGGTTLRDFRSADGSSGHFRLSLCVYDRADQPCGRCGSPIRRTITGQRATYYCPRCQH